MSNMCKCVCASVCVRASQCVRCPIDDAITSSTVLERCFTLCNSWENYNCYFKCLHWNWSHTHTHTQHRDRHARTQACIHTHTHTCVSGYRSASFAWRCRCGVNSAAGVLQVSSPIDQSQWLLSVTVRMRVSVYACVCLSVFVWEMPAVKTVWQLPHCRIIIFHGKLRHLFDDRVFISLHHLHALTHAHSHTHTHSQSEFMVLGMCGVCFSH